MKEEFDFKKVGKRMPYRVPSDFFEEITKRTLAEAENRVNDKKQPVLLYRRLMSVAAVITLLLAIGLFLYTGNRNREEKMVAEARNTEAPAPDTLLVRVPAISGNTQKRVKAAPGPVAAARKSAKIPEQQPVPTDKPETLENILATISDEELLVLAALAESDLNVYQQAAQTNY